MVILGLVLGIKLPVPASCLAARCQLFLEKLNLLALSSSELDQNPPCTAEIVQELTGLLAFSVSSEFCDSQVCHREWFGIGILTRMWQERDSGP